MLGLISPHIHLHLQSMHLTKCKNSDDITNTHISPVDNSVTIISLVLSISFSCMIDCLQRDESILIVRRSIMLIKTQNVTVRQQNRYNLSQK